MTETTNSPYRLSISIIAGSLVRDINCSSISDEMRDLYGRKLASIVEDDSVLAALCLYNDKITVTDIKYLLCFFVGMSATDISILFNIEINSVYTVRYRIRKKLKDNPHFAIIPL